MILPSAAGIGMAPSWSTWSAVRRWILLPDRTAATLIAWLQAHPEITTIARDRSQEYTRAATEGAPQAQQVVDRWHLLKSLREAVMRYLQQILPALRRLIAPPPSSPPAAPPPPTHDPPPTAVPLRPLPRYGRHPQLERTQQARHAQRAALYAEIAAGRARGETMRQIAARTGLCTRTISRWVRVGTCPVDQRGSRRARKIDPYVPYLQARLAEGWTNRMHLWREIRKQGFTGTASLVRKWILAQGGTRPTPRSKEPVLPGVSALAWLVVRDAAQRSAEETALWQQLAQHAGVQEMAQRVHELAAMMRQR